jgi:hypothetical protein
MYSYTLGTPITIATGYIKPGSKYLTEGTAESTYKEEIRTIQFEVLPSNSTVSDLQSFVLRPFQGRSGSRDGQMYTW